MLKSDKTLDGTLIATLRPASEKRVELICDDCGREGTTNYHNYMLSQKKRGNDGKTSCKPCAMVRTGLAKRGKEIKKSGPRPNAHAEKNHSWKGGRFVGSDGYVQIYIGPGTYRKEHFLVMEAAIGRQLTSDEVIHHIDGDKQNNKLENLVLFASESEHRAAHNSLYDLSCVMIRAGAIKFDRNFNRYVQVNQ